MTGDDFRAGASGFAAGALLVMLVDSMIPEAQSKAKESTGLATVLGFALAAGLVARLLIASGIRRPGIRRSGRT